jgi:subtilisin family serine protease
MLFRILLFCAFITIPEGWAAELLPIVRLRVTVGTVPTCEGLQVVVNKTATVKTIKRIFPKHADTSRLGRWYEIHFATRKEAETALSYVKGCKWVEEAEVITAPEITFRPNDPSYTLQSGYLSALGVEAAWDSCQGDTSVVIAIVDTGFDLDHPDLAANVSINYAEPINGLDDDNDGFIDNRTGIDLAGATYQNMIPDNNPTSASGGGHGHGVHVAGIAAAVGNNGVGVAGIAYKCRLLPIKACADNSTSLWKAYEGMVYAADKGADIINCSFMQGDYSPMAADAVLYCHQKGVIVIAGAGNTSASGPQYPANLPGVVSVASCEITGVKSGFSSFGPWVGIMAPGSGIQSTDFNNIYTVRSGTSMSSPVVSGVMGLLKSYHKTETRAQLIARMLATADTSVLTLPGNAAFQNALGTGRVHVGRALFYKGPAFRVESIKAVTLNGDDLTGNEDSVRFDFVLRNHLGPSTRNAKVIIDYSTSGTLVNLGRVASQGIVTGSFKLDVPNTTADNISVVVRFTFRDSGGYSFSENRVLLVNISSQNWEAPHFKTTSTSVGRLGYINNFTQGGLGINYKGVTHLYEGGYLLGLGGDTVFSVVRGNPGQQNNDFARINRVRKLPAGSFWRTEAFFTDRGVAAQQVRGIKVRLLQGAGLVPADSNIILSQATVTNTTRSAFRNLYWGLFADWDISPGGLNDAGGYAASVNMPYMRSSYGPLFYYGIVPLSPTTAGALVLNNFGTGIQQPINDGWPNAEKAEFLRVRSQWANQMRPPNFGDVSVMVNFAATNIAAGDSTVFAHAIVFAQDSATLVERALAAKRLYDVVTQTKNNVSTFSWSLFPNPAENQVIVTTQQTISLSLYSATGVQVGQWNLAPGQHAMAVQQYPGGLYLLKDNKGNTRRLLLLR